MLIYANMPIYCHRMRFSGKNLNYSGAEFLMYDWLHVPVIFRTWLYLSKDIERGHKAIYLLSMISRANIPSCSLSSMNLSIISKEYFPRSILEPGREGSGTYLQLGLPSEVF